MRTVASAHPSMSGKTRVRMKGTSTLYFNVDGYEPRRSSGNEEHLPRRLPGFERPVRLRRVLQRKLELGAQLDLTVADPAQELLGALQELGARDDVVVQAGPREEERALCVERLRVERADGAARLAVQRHHAPRRQAVESLVAGPLA